MILVDQLERLGAGPDLLRDAIELVVEDDAEPLGEDRREDEVIELGCLLCVAETARGIPALGLERFVVFIAHEPSATRGLGQPEIRTQTYMSTGFRRDVPSDLRDHPVFLCMRRVPDAVNLALDVTRDHLLAL